MTRQILGISKAAWNQYTAGFISSISVIILGTAIGWPAPSIPKLLADDSPVKVTKSEIAWMVSLMYLANMISPMPTGHLMDRFGRKNTMLALTIFPILSWITLLYASQPYHLYIGRFLIGLSFGVVYTVIPIYLAEISETHRRGQVGNSISVMTYGGAVYVYSVGPYVTYSVLIYSCFLVPIIFILTFMWMPESPYYQLMKGDYKGAKEVLKWLRSGYSQEQILKELDTMEMSTKEQMKLSGRFIDLISTPGNRKALTIVVVLAISQRLTGVGPLMAYSSITIPKDSVPGLSLDGCVTILGIVWFLSSIQSSLLVERLGRKFLLSVSTAGCGVSTLLACAWFYLDERTDVPVDNFRWLPFTAFLFHALFYSLGIGPIGSAIKGELFPANVKGKASAVTTVVLALTSFVINKAYISIATSVGMFMNFLIFGVTCFCTVIFVIFYVIETKGKSLQEIQNELNYVPTSEKIIDKTDTQTPS